MVHLEQAKVQVPRQWACTPGKKGKTLLGFLGMGVYVMVFPYLRRKTDDIGKFGDEQCPLVLVGGILWAKFQEPENHLRVKL